MTVNVKKIIDGVEQIKSVQTEDLNYYRSTGWEETTEAPKPSYTSKRGRKSYFEEEKVEEKEED